MKTTTIEDLHDAQRDAAIVENLCVILKRPQGELLEAVRTLKADIEDLKGQVAALRDKP